MLNAILVRYSEIGIKGKNRPFFEKMLVKNIKDCLRKNNLPYQKVNRYRGRIIIFTNNVDNSIGFLKNVFGIASLSPAKEIDADLEEIKRKVLEFALKKDLVKDKSFRITSKRLNKLFPYDSMKINEIIGSFIQEKTKARVMLEKADLNIRIEVIEKKAYVFCHKINCFGGLPVGTEGKVICVIESYADVLAALLMMKHGCEPLINIINNKNIHIDLIKKFVFGFDLKIIKNMDDADSDVLVVGQTIKNYNKIKTNKLVLRPLISYTDEEVKDAYNLYRNS